MLLRTPILVAAVAPIGLVACTSSDDGDGLGAGASSQTASSQSAASQAAASSGGSGGATATGAGGGGQAGGAVCGDGVVNGSEECDPGPAVNDVCYGPGFPEECTAKPSLGGNPETCPGAAFAILLGESHWLGPFDATTSTDDELGSCSAVGGRDHVFQATPANAGTLTVEVGIDPVSQMPWCAACASCNACWSPALYVRDGTCADGEELGCDSDPTFATTSAAVQVPVTASAPYWIIVDSSGGAVGEGAYYLHIALD